MNFSHLTPEQRYKIDALLNASEKISQKSIAQQVGVSESTISREKQRNSRPRMGYQAVFAQSLAKKRRYKKPFKINGELEEKIRKDLQQEWSPEQIVGRMALENTGKKSVQVSHETIYKYIYRKQKQGDKIYLQLRRRRKKRLKRLKKDDGRGKIPNKIMIDQRPTIIENKDRIGDWEGDTIIGKDHQGAMLTLVERKSKYTLIFSLKSKTAQAVEDKMRKSLTICPVPFHSVTFDNGREFTNHQKIAQNMECQVFFAFPYHSWQRGLNENTNGLIRQYIPKKTDFKDYSDEYIKQVQNKLNNRPRKTLDFLTPIEYLKKMKIAFEN
jgi:transposase, IS30 family